MNINMDNLEEFGFTPEQIERIPDNFTKFIFSHYTEVELKILSPAAIIKSASLLYQVYHPDEEKITPNQILDS